jgi:hypothetical protein
MQNVLWGYRYTIREPLTPGITHPELRTFSKHKRYDVTAFLSYHLKNDLGKAILNYREL